jgi:hypothetical protein
VMTSVFCTICNCLIFPIMLSFRFPLLLTHGQLRMVSVLIFGHSHLLAYYVLSLATPSSIAVRCSIIVDSISSSFVVWNLICSMLIGFSKREGQKTLLVLQYHNNKILQ